MNENNSVVTPSSSVSSTTTGAAATAASSATSGGGGGGDGGGGEVELDVTNGDGSAAAKPTQESLPGGLRRFGSFAEYVETSRAEGGSSTMPMPVVSVGGKDVTIPSVIIVGGQRTGTSSLFSMLGQHPGVGSIEPDTEAKRTRGFMAQDPQSYPHEAEWPGDNLETDLPADVLGGLLEELSRPFSVSESRVEGTDAPNLVTTALSPGYLASPLAPYRLKVALPDVKIIMVVRDPTDRYFSELKDTLCVKDEKDIDWEDITVSFAMPNASKDYLSNAVVDYSPYDKTCQGEKASASDLWGCQTASEKSHRPLLEGLYASQISRWQRAFDESQLHVVESTKLFQEPEKVAADVAKFAGLEDKHAFFEFAVDRAASCDPRRRSAMIATAYSKRREAEPQLRKWYADHNDMLSELLDKETHWNDRIRSALNNNQL
eukprot:g8132.t1